MTTGAAVTITAIAIGVALCVGLLVRAWISQRPAETRRHIGLTYRGAEEIADLWDVLADAEWFVAKRFGILTARSVFAGIHVRVFPAGGRIGRTGTLNGRYHFHGLRRTPTIDIRRTADSALGTALLHEVFEHRLPATLRRGVNRGHAPEWHAIHLEALREIQA